MRYRELRRQEALRRMRRAGRRLAVEAGDHLAVARDPAAAEIFSKCWPTCLTSNLPICKKETR